MNTPSLCKKKKRDPFLLPDLDQKRGKTQGRCFQKGGGKWGPKGREENSLFVTKNWSATFLESEKQTYRRPVSKRKKETAEEEKKKNTAFYALPKGKKWTSMRKKKLNPRTCRKKGEENPAFMITVKKSPPSAVHPRAT